MELEKISFNKLPSGMKNMFNRAKDVIDKQNYEYGVALLSELIQAVPGFSDARELLRKAEIEKTNRLSGFPKIVASIKSAFAVMRGNALLAKKDLREAIGIVLQDTVLFSDTIRQNIMYGNFEADEESMKKAASMARADEFIERLPEGYDTQLTEAGRNLSQGQRQLLSISRAILKDPKILILDEATSSVDTRTEMNIQSAMVALMKNRTSLIIAHRLSTIRDADVIVVISKGAVVEAGNHEELLALGGEYHKLYSSQFAGVAI